MDEVNDLRIQGFLENKKLNKQNFLLENITEKEVIEYCKLVKIPTKKQKHNELIEQIENKYPGSKFALSKSLSTIKRIEK